MIYRFRVILDTKEDVFRDFEIDQNETLEVFHNCITQAFGFEGDQMASFYISDEKWGQGEEISLFDMSDGDSSVRLMNETSLDTVTHQRQTLMLYVYDFLSMWTFMVELAEVVIPESGREYPNLMFSHGELPDSAPEKNFETEDDGSGKNSEDDDLSVDGYDNLGFDEHWN